MSGRRLLAPFLLVTLAGCVDNAESISREYRNTINEGIDAMMMVTTEAQAEAMTVRIFKSLGERFQALDKKVKILDGNRTKIDFVKEVFESDGANLLFTELDQNKQRFALELTRMRILQGHYIARERTLLGDPNAAVNPNEVCPKLTTLINEGGTPLEPLRRAMASPELYGKLVQVYGLLKADPKQKLFPIFEEKRKIFDRDPVRLVN